MSNDLCDVESVDTCRCCKRAMPRLVEFSISVPNGSTLVRVCCNCIEEASDIFDTGLSKRMYRASILAIELKAVLKESSDTELALSEIEDAIKKSEKADIKHIDTLRKFISDVNSLSTQLWEFEHVA